MKELKAALRRPGGAAALLLVSYTVGILAYYPWYMKELLGIAPFKLVGFLAFTLLCVLLLSFVMPERRFTRPARPTLWVLGYAGAAVASTAFSLSPKDSLWATQGYIGGVFLVLACAAGYLAVVGYLAPGHARALWYPLCISGALNAAYTVATAFGWDPFGFHSVLGEADSYVFFGTIGNVDYFNSYLCLWLPVALWYWLMGEGRQRPVAGACTACGLVALAALDPGIATLGLLGAAALLLCLVPLHRAIVARLLRLAACWLLAQQAVCALAAHLALRMQERPFAAFGTSAFALPATIVLLAVGVYLERPGGATLPDAACLRIGRALAALPAVLLVAGAVAVNLGGLSFGAFDNFLRLDADWATGRGALFADAFAVFGGVNPLHKLVGVGPGMFWRCVQTMSVPYPLPDAIGTHCEYLQELVCGGLLGLGVWLGVLASHLRPAARSVRRGDYAAAPWLLAATAYAVQAAFNNRVAAVFPLFMVVLGVLRCAQISREAEQPFPRGHVALALGLAIALGAVATVLGNLLLAPLLR